MAGIPAIISNRTINTLSTITGNMLGDGNIRYNNMARGKGARAIQYDHESLCS